MRFKRENMHDSPVGQTGSAGVSSLDQYDKYAIHARYTNNSAEAATFDTGAAEETDITCVADTGAVAVQTLTFPAKASIASGDMIRFQAADGMYYAAAADLTGTDAEPSAVEWTSLPSAQRAHVDLSAATTAAQVAAAFELAIDALTGLSAKITTDDAAADGTMTLTQTKVGPVESVFYSTLDGEEDGSLLSADTTAGVASNLNNTSFTINAGSTAVVVKMNVNSEGAGDGDVNVAIAAGAANTAVATALAAALDAESEFGASAVAAVVTVTNAADASSVDAADSASAPTGFTFEVQTQGITGLDLATETIYAEAHGYPTGTLGRLTTSAADLPAGLATATDYYIIKVDDDHFKLASSLSNANAGTAVNITDAGSGTHTFTPTALAGASIKLQYSVDGTNWEDVADTSTNITATGSVTWQKADVAYEKVRAYVTLSAGLLDLDVTINKKG